jgi:hypothetical protein
MILDLMDQSIKALRQRRKWWRFGPLLNNRAIDSDVTPTWQGLQGLSEVAMEAGDAERGQALQGLAKKVRARAGKC